MQFNVAWALVIYWTSDKLKGGDYEYQQDDSDFYFNPGGGATYWMRSPYEHIYI